MENRLHSSRQKGHYFGTEIDEKWWKRYKKSKMFARGTGEFWYDEEAFYFLRYLTKEPISIAYKDIRELKTGKWHAGQWGAGRTVLKLVWTADGQRLSSGFSVSKDQETVENLKTVLENYLK